MSVPSKCPRCDQPVMVPDGLSDLARLRCPLCNAEYSAAEVLASAPPLLTVLDLGPSPAESGQWPSAATSGLAGAVSAPAPDTEASPTGAAAEATGLGEAGQPDAAVGSATGGESVPDFLGKVDEAPQLDLGDATSGGPTEGVDSAAFAGFAEQEAPAEDQGAVDRLLSARRPPSKRREKSLAREMIGALIGGFVGLTLGFYLLNYFGGERFFWVKVYLPGVPHSYNSWPFGPKASPEEGESAQPDAGRAQPSASAQTAPPSSRGSAPGQGRTAQGPAGQAPHAQGVTGSSQTGAAQGEGSFGPSGPADSSSRPSGPARQLARAPAA